MRSSAFYSLVKKIIVAIMIMTMCMMSFSGCAMVTSDEYDFQCTLYIECTTILNNLDDFNADKLDILPEDGIILEKTVVGFNEGESVYDLLVRETRQRGIHMEASYTPIYDSSYVEGIHNLYEFDCGGASGWTYCVNDWFPNYGCSSYFLEDGDIVEWYYTCDYGNDVGCTWIEGEI